MSLEKEIDRRSPKNIAVEIPIDGIALRGELTVPRDATGLVIFCKGEISARSTLQNRAVAKIFSKYHLATLLTDIPASEYFAFWLQQNPETSDLSLGYFSTDEEVAKALVTAARQPDLIKAVVSCGGLPDSAIEFLPKITAPVLLIASSHDPEGLRSSQASLRKLNKNSSLNVIPRSFDDPFAKDEATQLAALWFSQHLG